MHFRCTRTCYSFTSHDAELFRDHVGQEALRHDYLFEALLAIILLHIASEMDDPSDIATRPLVSVLPLRSTILLSSHFSILLIP